MSIPERKDAVRTLTFLLIRATLPDIFNIRTFPALPTLPNMRL